MLCLWPITNYSGLMFWSSQNLEEDEQLYVDVHDYRMFLLELITGKNARCFQAQGKGQSLANWVRSLGQPTSNKLTKYFGSSVFL